ncbi:tyrosine-type recombinase/integrase [Occallatibacter savannae]|uniref:tyrosine-type recombinase/integrase n=1 Tax=Occallatibacter savannae TaxID=1002691 RepID=UPI003B8392DF
MAAGVGCESQEVTHCDSSSQNDARRARASQLLRRRDATLSGVSSSGSHSTSASRRTSWVRIICAATRRICSGERKLCPGSVENHVAALRFFYVRTLRRHEFREFLPYPKTHRKLPEILSQEEVARLIDASATLFQRKMLMVLYGTGMRRSELARLKIAHIANAWSSTWSMIRGTRTAICL